MTKLIDLKLQAVEEELDNYLEVHRDRISRSISTNPNLRQKLIDYVMCKVPGYCIILEDSEKISVKKRRLFLSVNSATTEIRNLYSAGNL